MEKYSVVEDDFFTNMCGAVIYNEGCLNRGEIPGSMYTWPMMVGISEFPNEIFLRFS